MAQQESSQNLFIGSLAYTTTDDSLRAHFEQIGPVESAQVVTDREDGKSRGFGFVKFENDEDHQKAIDQLNGKELDGRAINVSFARPREERPRRDFGNNSNSRNRNGGGNGGNSFRQRSW